MPGVSKGEIWLVDFGMVAKVRPALLLTGEPSKRHYRHCWMSQISGHVITVQATLSDRVSPAQAASSSGSGGWGGWV
jgi:mRNA-degrading endonuclease toxin of MazEF toxin-antitoxin module